MSRIESMKRLNILVVPVSIMLLIYFYFNGSIIFFPFLIVALITSVMAIRSLTRERKPRIPIPFLSSGKLIITDSEVSFTSEPYNAAGLTYHNLSLNLQFRLKHAEIKRIERFAPHKEFEGYSRSFSNEWVRIYAKEDIFQEDFLLAVGGSGFGIRSQRKQTDEIYAYLSRLVQ